MCPMQPYTANLRTKILDLRGFDSSTILILRGGIPRPVENSPESLSEHILEVERLGLPTRPSREASFSRARSCPLKKGRLL